MNLGNVFSFLRTRERNKYQKKKLAVFTILTLTSYS